jgi:hypothetical protein
VALADERDALVADAKEQGWTGPSCIVAKTLHSRRLLGATAAVVTAVELAKKGASTAIGRRHRRRSGIPRWDHGHGILPLGACSRHEQSRRRRDRLNVIASIHL